MAWLDYLLFTQILRLQTSFKKKVVNCSWPCRRRIRYKVFSNKLERLKVQEKNSSPQMMFAMARTI